MPLSEYMDWWNCSDYCSGFSSLVDRLLRFVISRRERCPIHIDKNAAFICEDCEDVAICKLCATQNHKGHNLGSIEEGRAKKVKEFNQYKEELGISSNELKCAHNEIQTEKKKINEDYDRVRKEVNQHFEKLKREKLEEFEEERRMAMESLDETDSMNIEKEKQAKKLMKETRKWKYKSDQAIRKFIRESPQISNFKPNLSPEIDAPTFEARN